MKQNEKSYRWTEPHQIERDWGEILEQLDHPRFVPSQDNKWGLSRIMTEQRKYHRSKD
jgi:hypothetical protein